MQIVPVIDLKQGNVVHARSGQRHLYEPVRSLLCDGSDPVSVVGGLLELFPFPVLYIADLDSIAGGPGHERVLERINTEFPPLQLWVDCGISSAAAGSAWLARGLGELVVGSETVVNAGVPGEIVSEEGDAAVILSLDFKDGRFLGPKRLLREADLWPRRVIVMTLGRVGSDAGPDFACIDAIARRHRDKPIFAAGGVRNVNDLHDLASRGVAGVLVASSLHDGRIGSRDIAGISRAGAR